MALWPFGRGHAALIYRREGGSPPVAHETMTVEQDGGFDLWRTAGGVAPIGRFRGKVPAHDWSILTGALEECRRAQPIHLSLAPDAAEEKVILGKATSTWAEDSEPPPPFGDLASVTRRLLSDLTEFPDAAVALRLTGTPSLVHLGSSSIELDLSGASVRAVRWEGGVAADSWERDVGGPRSVTADGEWTYEIPFDHPFNAGEQVTAVLDNLLAFDGEFWWSCSLQTRRG